VKETLIRSASGLIFGVVVIGAIMLGPWTHAALWVTVASLAVREFQQGTRRVSAITVWGFAAFVALWLSVMVGMPWQESGSYEPSVLLGLIFMIWMNDSGAYFVGKPLGKHKLMPSVSPGKSWEGLIGGGAAAAMLAGLLWGWSFVWMGPVVAVLATSGDLIESAWKRRNGIKDSGSIMPGHGGVMDRFDGFILTAPVYAILLSLLPFESNLKFLFP
jgi:phosphatidate cytidylyltransferase